MTSLFWEWGGVAEGSLNLSRAGNVNLAESCSPLNSIVGDTGISGVTQHVPLTRGREKPGSKGGHQTGSALPMLGIMALLEIKDKLREEREQLWIVGEIALVKTRKTRGKKRGNKSSAQKYPETASQKVLVSRMWLGIERWEAGGVERVRQLGCSRERRALAERHKARVHLQGSGHACEQVLGEENILLGA